MLENGKPNAVLIPREDVDRRVLHVTVSDCPSIDSNETAITTPIEHGKLESWKIYLADCESTPFPALPTSPKRPVMGDITEHHFSRPTHSAAASHITENTIFCTAWTLMAGQITNSKDVTFGVLMGKDVSKNEKKKAGAVEVLPMRLKLEGKAKVAACLEEAQHQCLERIQMEQVELAEIANMSEEARQACMFQTLFVIHAPETDPHRTTFADIGTLQQFNRALAIEILPELEKTQIRATFDSGIIQPNAVERLLERLCHIALQLSNASTEKRIEDIETVTTRDLQDIWRHNHSAPAPVKRCVHEAIESRALTHPLAPAICAWDGELTYYDLDRLASSLSRLLVQSGVGPDVVVPLCFEKSMWTPVAMLGVLKAGGAFVLLDPAFPEKRLREIIRQVGSTVFLSSTANEPLSLRLAHNVVVVNSNTFANHDALEGDPEIPSVRNVSPASAAYVIFTSGSTGTPKGVKITHRNVASTFLREEHLFGCTADSRIYDIASYSFVAALVNFFAALTAGGCLCIPKNQDRTADISNSFVSLQSNTVILTPSVATTLSPDRMRGLRLLILTGEVVRLHDIQPWWGHTKILSVYGNSECGGCVTINDSGSSPEQLASSGIGRGVGAVTWVVDPDNHHCILPPGCIGELLIESPIASPGYIGNRATEAFVHAPAWLQRGTVGFPGRNAMLYKTGDLVKQNENGTLNYFGRKDSQIKIRGQRVELGDVEYTVQKCLPGAAKAIVELITPEGNKAKPTLATFLLMKSREALPREDTNSDATVLSVGEDVEARLYEELPSHMVPHVFFSVQTMPMTPTGKINRRKLREMGSEFSMKQLATLRTSGRGRKRRPSTEPERKMQQLWAQVLGLEPEHIGLNDSFFLLGGDSIDLIKLVGVARRADIQNLAVADVFRHPKLGDLVNSRRNHTTTPVASTEEALSFFSLATDVEVSSIYKEVAATCGIDPGLIEDIYPCSPLQEGLMSLSSRKAGDYINQSVLQLRDEVDETALWTAWNNIAQSTPMLRTRLVQTSKSGLLQAVIAEEFQWREVVGLEEHLREDKCTSMEVGEPLVRYALVREPGKRWFVWTIHHCLYDGWSLPLVIDAARKHYYGEVMQERASFRTFIKYLSQIDQGSAEAFWQSYLLDCQATPFPSLPSSVQQPLGDMTIQYQCQPLPKVGNGMTISTLIRSAWAIIAARYTNSDDVVFGSILSGRNAPVSGIDTMIGPTIATVPVRVRVGDQDVLSFLEETQRQTTAMIPFEQTGLQTISKMGPDAQHACQFQTLIVIQPEGGVVERNETIGTWRHTSELQDFATYALAIQFMLAPEGVQITASFDSHVIERWRVDKMLRQFSFVIQQLAVADSSMRVADVNVLTPEDRQQLWEWNQLIPPAADSCIHDLFIKQAKAQPYALAISAWDGELTYSELDELSNRLAGYLVNIGAKPEDIVPLCFEKSLWTVVAMLAVLKAGAAFLLLDPSLPVERLRLMCRKARAKYALASHNSASAVEGLADTYVLSNKQSLLQLPEFVSVTRANPSNTAYVIFTSGSTGTPKGCKIEHRSSCTALEGHGQSLQMNSNTRTLQFGSYSFAGCLVEMLLSLVHGCCICIPSEEERRTGLSAAIRKMKANWAFLTASVLDTVGSPDAVPSLATLCVGGEPIRASQIQQWQGRVHLRQTYGSSELSGIVSSAQLGSTSLTEDVGKAGTGAYWIVDPSNHCCLAPLGAIGELLVEGPVLGQSYIDEPEKTAATFIAAPQWRASFSEFQPRLYRTGDLARYKEDGSIELLGRKDTQVKLRGQRIELGEIEHQARLAGEGNVKELAVELVRPQNADANDMLACFIAFGDQGPAETDVNGLLHSAPAQTVVQAIRSRLEKFLPHYMVPGLYVPLVQLPRAFSGKTDRKRLREMGGSFSTQQLAQMRTRQGPKRQPSEGQENEKMLQRLWGRVLNIEADDIGLEDSFFHLGGDSIAIMKLVAAAREEDVQLTAADIFRNEVLADLARLIQVSATAAPQPASNFSSLTPSLYETIFSGPNQFNPYVHRDNVENIQHVSSIQNDLLLQGKRNPRAAFNYLFFDLDHCVDVERLETSCRSLAQHFALLRTHFAYFEDHLLQMVLRDFQVPFFKLEVNGSIEAESNALCLRDAEHTSPFGVPTSFMFIGNASKASRLIIRLSHAQYDGMCIPVILNALASFYNGETLSPAPDFSTYLAYAHQMKQASTQYWKNLLKSSRVFSIASKLSSKTCEYAAPRNIELKCSLAVPQLPKGVTMASLVSSAWALILSEISGKEDVVYGYVVAGRNSNTPGITEIVGPCVNIIPVRADLSAARTGADLIHTIQEQYASLGESDSMGFRDIVKQCTDWPSGTVLDSVVHHRNIDANPDICLAGRTSRLQWFDNPFFVTPYLSVLSQAKPSGLDITIAGNTHIFTTSCAEQLLDSLCKVIAKLSDNLQVPLAACKSSVSM